MRDIGQNLDTTKKRVLALKGISVQIEVNEGRNKISSYCGNVENVYPSVFTFKTLNGALKTFSYNDVLTKGVKFFKV